MDEVDSDIEREAQTNYDREITKEDLAELHTLAKMEIKASNVPRAPAPDYGVRLAFVHGLCLWGGGGGDEGARNLRCSFLPLLLP